MEHIVSSMIIQNNWPSISTVGQFFYILLVFIFVLLLAYYSTRLLAASKGGVKKGCKNLEMIESMGVSGNALIQIVRAGDKYLVVGVTKETVTFIAEVDGSQLKPAEASILRFDNTFEKALKRFVTKNKNNQNDGGAQDE